MHRENEGIGPLPADLEQLIGDLVGQNWRSLPEREVNGALGIAIVHAVLKGCSPNASNIANYLGIEKWQLYRPLKALSLNGVFQRHKLDDDKKKLEQKDPLTWLYYAGYASEATGNVAAGE